MRVNFHDDITPLSARTIREILIHHIGSSNLDYIERKSEYLKSVGFEDGAHQIKFTIVGDDKLNQLIDISLGKKNAIEVEEIHGSSLRFGVLSERKELTSDTAILTMPDVTPTDTGFISFRDKSNGRTLKFLVDVYSSPFNSWIPKHYRKIRMDGKLFEFNILDQGKSFNISMNIHLIETFEVEDSIRMFKLTHMLAKPQDIELTFEFQGSSSTARLNSGVGFPDQSHAIEALEKILKIKQYFEVDAPLYFTSIDINNARNRLKKSLHIVEGAPEIFRLNFSSETEISTPTELECFHILSFQVGRYVFLELALFLGNAEKSQDDGYNLTPTSRTSFYRTMFEAGVDLKYLEEEITKIIDDYDSPRMVINFVPGFFTSAQS